MNPQTDLTYRYSVSDEKIRHDYGRILSDLDKSQTAHIGFENEIALCKATISALLETEILDSEIIRLVLEVIDRLVKLQTEERRERERREKSELAQLKYQLMMQTINSINVKEYQEALTQVRKCIEEFVPKSRLAEFGAKFAEISANKKVIL
jgi:hypothetical protein